MHSPRVAWSASVVAVVALVGSPVCLLAQERAARSGSAVVWPATRVPVDVGAAVRAFQERPLPVYDDDGTLIRLSEIEMEVDPSGNAGLFWGLLAGVSLGSAIGHAMAPGECEYVSGGYQYYCSPREEALNTALPGGLAMVAGVLGAWIGWELDHVSFQEALEKIRNRRREGR